MQGSMAIRNEPKAMPVMNRKHMLWVSVSATVAASASAASSESWQKLWIYPASAVAASGVPTANVEGATLRVGFKGPANDAVALALPDSRDAADTDAPLIYELPVGMRMRLADVWLLAPVGAGALICWC
jgi:hypothetical protein